jgi:hypothetical protein
MPVRIFDIAKKFSLEAKEVLAKAKSLGIASAKVPSSSLDKISAEWLEGELLKDHPDVFLKNIDQSSAETPPTRLIEGKFNITSPDKKGEGLTRKIVLPICNCRHQLVSVCPCIFPDSLSLDQIADEDFATLFREQQDIFMPIVSANSQCFAMQLPAEREPAQMLLEMVAKVQFVFKTLSHTPLIFSHAAVVLNEGKRKAVVERVLPLPVWGDYSKHTTPFTFKEDVSSEAVFKFYEIINTAISKQPAFFITLNRFNSCWLRSTDHDKIIDVAISLESLLSSSTEISFKFALFNSFLARTTPTGREEAFQLFKLLYDARSKIVHGDIKHKSISKVIEVFPQIMDLAHAAISYCAFFLYSHNPNEWQNHLDKLVFGTAKPIEPLQNENKEKK